MSAAMTHTDLMRQMGTPPEDGFDPMPPRQHGYFLDIDESMPNRGIAWVWSKTIRPGRGKKRSPFARDERGALTHVHAAADLGWTVSNARVLFQKLADQMRVQIDEKGRIWLRGDAPEPRRTKGEELPSPAEPGDGENDVEDIYIFPTEKQRSHFQRLTKPDLQRALSEYLELKKFKNQILAEAAARGRAVFDRIESQWFSQFGYEEKDPRGRPKNTPEEPVVDLLLRSVPNFVHISEADFVHKSKDNFVQPEIGVVHISLPYSSSENRDTEKDLGGAEPELERRIKGEWVGEKAPLTHLPSEVASTLEEAGFPVAADDPLLAKFEALPTEHQIPPRSVCRAIRDKVRQKRAKGQRIDNAGALYGFVNSDMGQWILRNGRVVAEDTPRSVEAEDPEEHARWLLDMQARLEDPELSQAEKKIIRRAMGQS